jgi:hypothetical protein
MAFGLARKDPNRWFKVCIVSCQICRKRLLELASLGRCRGRFHVNRPARTILRDRGMSSDHFGACVVNFGGHMRH